MYVLPEKGIDYLYDSKYISQKVVVWTILASLLMFSLFLYLLCGVGVWWMPIVYIFTTGILVSYSYSFAYYVPVAPIIPAFAAVCTVLLHQLVEGNVFMLVPGAAILCLCYIIYLCDFCVANFKINAEIIANEMIRIARLHGGMPKILNVEGSSTQFLGAVLLAIRTRVSISDMWKYRLFTPERIFTFMMGG